MPRWPERARLLAQLALADLWHDRKVSLCVAAALMAVVAPLLLLFGLKYGVVSQLQAQLLSDPRNLEIKLLGSGNFDSQWLQALQQRPETGFAVGLTRSLNTQADLLGEQGRFVENAEVLPTGAGDPLLAGVGTDLAADAAVLSAASAERLGVSTGGTVRLRIQRRLEGQPQRGELRLEVRAVLPAQRFARPGVFVAPALLQQLERFRDGYQTPLLGAFEGAEQAQLSPRYARARLYARDIDSVPSLARWLESQHLETSSRLAEIENVKAINHVLSVIFAVIAAAALCGCTASLAGAFLANIERKRRSLALLRLMGFQRGAAAGFIVLQALTLALLGYSGGLLGYLAGSTLFDRLLGGAQATGAFVCHITPWHALAALLLALLVAALVALTGAARAINIEPAESLREL
ncbi:FtsX-like permease family protein [Pseudomonas sp. RP23018S]|uniref:FtsX-like permease family protein n=1 Tax=Pseudomonas sp. RP23018S TaxID=3096037 RepID=UPI003A101C80